MGTGEMGTRERVGHVDYDVEIGFVVFPGSVVRWFQSADKLGLEHEGLELGIAEREFDGITGDDGRLFGVQFSVLGVTRQSGFEINCLADVEKFPIFPVLIHPAGSRCVVKILNCVPGELTHTV